MSRNAERTRKKRDQSVALRGIARKRRQIARAGGVARQERVERAAATSRFAALASPVVGGWVVRLDRIASRVTVSNERASEATS